MRPSFIYSISSILFFSWSLFLSPAMAEDNLCPQDAAAVKNVPGDVGGVQADIDRLNLCVERAKLLKQMDDIAKQRSEILHKVTDPNAGMGNSIGNSMGGLGMGAIPTIPMNALPDLPAVKTPDLKPGETRVNKAAGAAFGGDSETPAPAAKKAEWKIRKIWGQAGGVEGASMRAQLSDGSGTLLNVVKGDPLPDGKIVDSVSVKGVSVKGNGNITPLSWDDAASPDGLDKPPLATPLASPEGSK